MKTFNDYLIEVRAKIPKNANDEKVNSIPSLDKFKKKHVHHLGNVEGYQVVKIHGQKLGNWDIPEKIVVFKHNDAVGGIDYHKHENGFRVGSAYLHSQHQGKGLMAKVYKHVINKGINLLPGEDQTKGGESIWKKLKE